MDDARPTLVAAAFLVCLGSLSFTGEAAEADLPPLLAGLNSLEPPHRSIHSVMEDGDGLLWIGTFGGGLNHLDPTLRYARRICADPSTPDRCPGAVIWDLHLDDDGVLWIAGANLWSLDTRTKEARRFTLGGRLPKEGLSYIVEHSMGALWLAGFDEEWVDAGTRRTCQYTNLRPGEYVFHVRGSNNGGLWNETGAPLPAVIRPAVWQTWWFRSAAVALAGTLVWLLIAYCSARRRELQRLRLRIADDLHDDLSGDLSGIAVVTDMVQRHETIDADDRRDLAAVRDIALKMVDGVRDIVWYIDPEHARGRNRNRHDRRCHENSR